MQDLWKRCQAEKYISPLDCKAFRIVENQAKSSTRKLVKTLEEHEILESLLEATKPPLSSHLKKLHYLLFTPFRYPPLKYGSRFGTHHEQSIFYCSFELKTAMAEKAFYRLAFNRASHAPLGGKVLNLTSFQVHINTTISLDLCRPPFSKYRSEISSPISYQTSQKLGRDMRKNSIEAFSFFSARCPDGGKNLGLLSPKAFGNNKHIEKTFQTLFCYSTKDIVEFSNANFKETQAFNAADFMVNGVFPSVASF